MTALPPGADVQPIRVGTSAVDPERTFSIQPNIRTRLILETGNTCSTGGVHIRTMADLINTQLYLPELISTTNWENCPIEHLAYKIL